MTFLRCAFRCDLCLKKLQNGHHQHVHNINIQSSQGILDTPLFNGIFLLRYYIQNQLQLYLLHCGLEGARVRNDRSCQCNSGFEVLLYKVHPELVKKLGYFAFMLNPLVLAHPSKISAEQQRVLLERSAEQRGTG